MLRSCTHKCTSNSVLIHFLAYEGNGHFEKSLAGVPVGWKGQTKEDKIWNILSGMGDIAFAYAFSSILTNIQAGYYPPFL